MKMKIKANSVSRDWYGILEIDQSDSEKIFLYMSNDENREIEFRVGQIKYFRKGNNYICAIMRQDFNVFQVFIACKKTSQSLTNFEIDDFTGNVKHYLEIIYKYNFSECTHLFFAQKFTLFAKSFFQSNRFL